MHCHVGATLSAGQSTLKRVRHADLVARGQTLFLRRGVIACSTRSTRKGAYTACDNAPVRK